MKAVSSQRSLSGYLGLTVKGFCMGASDVIPGVSGGTMAFILGIYEELIQSIRSFDLGFVRLAFSLRFKEALDRTGWRFLLAVGLGILLAIFSLARALSWLLQNQPVLIWSFFFGLILASVVTVSRHLEKWSVPLLFWTALGTLATYLLVGLLPASTPNAFWFLFLSGAMAICAMILPGISGAFILVLLGKYQYVLDAVNSRDFLTLFLVAAGAAVGLVSFVRLVNWFFEKYHDYTVAVLTGLMLGSLRKIWPWKQTLTSFTDSRGHEFPLSQANILPPHWGLETIMALVLIALGVSAVLFLNHFAAKENDRR